MNQEKNTKALFNEQNNVFAGVRLQGLYKDIVNSELYENGVLEIEVFDNYLSGMLIRLEGKKGVEVDKNISILQWMKKFVHRQKYKNRIQGLQANLIASMEMDIRGYEIEIMNLKSENERLKNGL